MSRARSALTWTSRGLRVAAGAAAVSQLAKAAKTAAPLAPMTAAQEPTGLQRPPSIGVVIPARNEADRIGPLLDAITTAPGVREIIVVDDQSTDDTAQIAGAAGARVITGEPLPEGWAGKAWALQQGIEAATSTWVVTLDADTRPDPRLPKATVARAIEDDLGFLTVGGKFECPTPGARWLHASMLTTLVYRFGPPGADTPPDRAMANGQCMTLKRDEFLEAGGMSVVADQVVEDVALARHLASTGWSVAFLDAAELLTVRMFESFGDTWKGWGRSLALPGVESPARQQLDLAVIVLAQVLPLPRVLLRRGDVIDLALLAGRLGTLAGTRSAYDRADAAYWLSPFADAASAVALARGIASRGVHTWRGRTYG